MNFETLSQFFFFLSLLLKRFLPPKNFHRALFPSFHFTVRSRRKCQFYQVQKALWPLFLLVPQRNNCIIQGLVGFPMQYLWQKILNQLVVRNHNICFSPGLALCSRYFYSTIDLKVYCSVDFMEMVKMPPAPFHCKGFWKLKHVFKQ